MGYLCTNFSLPRPLCSRVRPDVCDRQTSDIRQNHRLMPPPYGGVGIIIVVLCLVISLRVCNVDSFRYYRSQHICQSFRSTTNFGLFEPWYSRHNNSGGYFQRILRFPWTRDDDNHGCDSWAGNILREQKASHLWY